MKTIFIACFHTLISRNIIATPVADILARAGLKVVVLIPDYKKEYFEKTYSRPGIIFEGVDVGLAVRSRMVRIFKRLVEAMPETRRAALGRRRDFSGRKKGLSRYFVFYWPLGVFGRFRWSIKLVRWLDFYFSPQGRFYRLLDEYKPDLVFSTDVQNEHDVALMQDARRHKIKIVGMVRSWDNLTTRHLRILPDGLAVHNEIIKKEAVEIAGFPADKITVTGIPHYDKYLRGAPKSREDFFREIGADPRKKLIVYVPICDFRLEDNSVDRFILEILTGLGVNVFVRFPPAERVDLRGFVKTGNMFFDHPGHVFDEKVMGDRDVTPAGDERLINALSFADVVVSGPSTVVIDAALFDRPIILVDFYPRPVKDDERIYEYGAEHILNLLAAGGTPVARSKEEFLQLLQDYFIHPERDRAGRERLVKEQCWKIDGDASQRVADYLIQALAKLPPHQFRSSHPKKLSIFFAFITALAAIASAIAASYSAKFASQANQIFNQQKSNDVITNRAYLALTASRVVSVSGNLAPSNLMIEIELRNRGNTPAEGISTSMWAPGMTEDMMPKNDLKYLLPAESYIYDFPLPSDYIFRNTKEDSPNDITIYVHYLDYVGGAHEIVARYKTKAIGDDYVLKQVCQSEDDIRDYRGTLC